jgi:hypothetical protein
MLFSSKDCTNPILPQVFPNLRMSSAVVHTLAKKTSLHSAEAQDCHTCMNACRHSRRFLQKSNVTMKTTTPT